MHEINVVHNDYANDSCVVSDRFGVKFFIQRMTLEGYPERVQRMYDDYYSARPVQPLTNPLLLLLEDYNAA